MPTQTAPALRGESSFREPLALCRAVAAAPEAARRTGPRECRGLVRESQWPDGGTECLARRRVDLKRTPCDSCLSDRGLGEQTPAARGCIASQRSRLLGTADL